MVTGAAGFIGSHLVDALLAKGHEVVALDRRSADHPVTVRNLAAALSNPRLSFHRIDLSADDVTALLPGVRTVFHLAGIGGVRSSWGTSFTDYALANIVGTERILTACETMAVHRLVLASSSSVYGQAEGASDEQAPTRPYSPYAVSKLAAENLCAAHTARRYTGLATTVVRYFTVYGPRQRADMAIARLLAAALTGTPFHLYGDGTQQREFTFVDDAVAATIAAAQTGNHHLVVNVGGGQSISMKSLIDTVGLVTGRPVQLEQCLPVAGDVDCTSADSSLAQHLLGYHPSIDLAEGLRRHAAWMAALDAAALSEFTD
ncbi:NAD-dependent epimerase/dehydratase family protein [Nocardia sp. NPDC059239]|uniref:NAD-dependent epimerase/dehydratase family protein n=1 Tax=Nocardia sp. NPDC059239 TaxID=3346785 RepID=UPI00367CBC0A